MKPVEWSAALLEPGWHIIVAPEMSSKHRKPGSDAPVERTVFAVRHTLFHNVEIQFWDGYKVIVHPDLKIKVVSYGL